MSRWRTLAARGLVLAAALTVGCHEADDRLVQNYLDADFKYELLTQEAAHPHPRPNIAVAVRTARVERDESLRKLIEEAPGEWRRVCLARHDVNRSKSEGDEVCAARTFAEYQTAAKLTRDTTVGHAEL